MYHHNADCCMTYHSAEAKTSLRIASQFLSWQIWSPWLRDFRWPHFTTPQNRKRKQLLQECSKRFPLKVACFLYTLDFVYVYFLANSCIIAVLITAFILYPSPNLQLKSFASVVSGRVHIAANETLPGPVRSDPREHKLMNCTIPALEQSGCRLMHWKHWTSITHMQLNRSASVSPCSAWAWFRPSAICFSLSVDAAWVCAIIRGQCTRAVIAG